HTRFSRDWSSDVCSSDLDPAADRDAAAGDGKADDRLGKLGSLVPAVAPLAQALCIFGVGIFLLNLEVNGGGIDKDHIDLKIEKVGDGEGDVSLDIIGRFQQEVHRPVELVHFDFVQAVDAHLGLDPVLHGELAGRGQCAIGHHGK